MSGAESVNRATDETIVYRLGQEYRLYPDQMAVILFALTDARSRGATRRELLNIAVRNAEYFEAKNNEGKGSRGDNPNAPERRGGSRSLTDTKDFPSNYSSDAVRVLDAMSFTEGKGVGLLGSMSLRSQQYAGDYDAFEIVNLDEKSDEEALTALASRFKEVVKNVSRMPNTYVGDIKSGSVEEWRVLPKGAKIRDGKLIGMDVVASRKKLSELERAKIISPNEKKYGEKLLKGDMTPARFLQARQKLKFHIVRWSVNDVVHGSKRLRDGRTFTLEEAFSSPTITKMDVISYVQNNRYTDFSMIYYFRNKGRLLNPDLYNFVDSIKESIIYYTSLGNPFKVLKRKFALAKFERDAKTISELTPILNSDLGRIYHVLGDISTLINLLEDEQPNPKTVKFEIDQFKSRLANVYTLTDYLKEEHTLLGEIESALKNPNPVPTLRKMEDRLQRILNENTPRIAGKGLVGGYLVMPPTEVEQLTKQFRSDEADRSGVAIPASDATFYLEKMLRNLTHIAYNNNNAAEALGWRVIADDVWETLPPRPDKDPKDDKPHEIDEGHKEAQRFLGRRVILGDRANPPVYVKYYANNPSKDPLQRQRRDAPPAPLPPTPPPARMPSLMGAPPATAFSGMPLDIPLVVGLFAKYPNGRMVMTKSNQPIPIVASRNDPSQPLRYRDGHMVPLITPNDVPIRFARWEDGFIRIGSDKEVIPLDDPLGRSLQ